MYSQQWLRHRTLHARAATLCLAAAFALAVAACSSGSTTSNANSTGGTKIAGGTATCALQPSSVPNYIFPFVSGTCSSTVNIEEFQYLMYRPLYWFGNGASPTLNTSLSLADAPVYNGLEPKPFDQVTAIGAPNCKVAVTSCDWDMADWGGGWSFAPDYYPTGETLFTTGGAVNSGGYSNAQNQSMIQQTLNTNSLAPLYTWQNYLSPSCRSSGSRTGRTS
jgi:hypothetical protein